MNSAQSSLPHALRSANAPINVRVRAESVILVVDFDPRRHYPKLLQNSHLIFWSEDEMLLKDALPKGVDIVIRPRHFGHNDSNHLREMCGSGVQFVNQLLNTGQMKNLLNSLLKKIRESKKLTASKQASAPSSTDLIANLIKRYVKAGAVDCEAERRRLLAIVRRETKNQVDEGTFNTVFNQIWKRSHPDPKPVREIVAQQKPDVILPPAEPCDLPKTEAPPVVPGATATKIEPPKPGLHSVIAPMFFGNQPIHSPIPRLLFPSTVNVVPTQAIVEQPCTTESFGRGDSVFVPTTDIDKAVQLLLAEACELEQQAREMLEAARLKRLMASHFTKG